MNGSARSALKRNRGGAFPLILAMLVAAVFLPGLLGSLATQDPCKAKKAWEDSQKSHLRRGWNLPAREPSYYQERLRQARESNDPELQREIPQLEAALEYLRLEADYLKAKNETLPRALDAARQTAQAVNDDASDAKQRLKTIRTTVAETLGCFPESQSLLEDLNAKIAALEAKERKKIAEADVDSLLSGADTAGMQTDTMLGGGELGVDLDTMLGGEGEDFGDGDEDLGDDTQARDDSLLAQAFPDPDDDPTGTPADPGADPGQREPGGAGGWAGVWSWGTPGETGERVTISVAGSSISASFQWWVSSVGTNGQWTNCKLTGNTVACGWTAPSGGPEGSPISGTLAATLTGDQITAQYKDSEGVSWRAVLTRSR